MTYEIDPADLIEHLDVDPSGRGPGLTPRALVWDDSAQAHRYVRIVGPANFDVTTPTDGDVPIWDGAASLFVPGPQTGGGGGGASGVGATVSVAGSSETVNHGLDSTPAPWEIDITPRNVEAGESQWWISDINSSAFTINLGTPPASGTADFAWSWQPRTAAAPPPVFTYDFDDIEGRYDVLFPDGDPLVLDINGSSNGRTALTLDALDATEDLEVLACLLFTQEANQRRGVTLRATGTTASESGLMVYLNRWPDERVEIAEYTSGTFTETVREGTDSVPLREWHYLRVRLVGSTVSVKYWPALEDEPAGWTVVDSTAISGAGRVGLWGFDNSAGWDEPLCAYFAYDTDGGTAPLPDETPGANQGATDFGGTTLGTVPSGWTAMPWGGTPNFTVEEVPELANRPLIEDDWEWRQNYDSQVDFWTLGSDGDALGFDLGDNKNRFLRWIGKDAPSRKVDLLALVRFTSSPSSIPIRLLAHNTTPTDDPDGGNVAASHYVLGIESTSEISLRYYDDSTGSTALDTVSFTSTVGTWYWMRLRVDASLVRGKVWEQNTLEPGAWQMEVLDGRFTEGRVGINPFGSNANQEIRWIGVGHEGAVVAVPAGLA